jgi:hypothetical protein
MKIFLVLTALAYTGLFLLLSSEPFTDAPNQLARAAIMKSLWFDPQSPFQGMFSARHFFMPYSLPDLGLVLLIRMLGFELAGPVWSTLTMLVLVGGVCVYARQVLATAWAFAAAVLCSWYFATNYLFILGFFSFQWGIAAAFVALGALEAWRREKSFGWVVLYVSLYIGACFSCYGAHLASFAILAAMVGIVGLIRVGLKQQNWMRWGWELAPFAVLTGYHLLLAPAHPEAAGGTLTHNTVADKFGHFVEAMFVRENYVVDRSILALFWGIVVAAIWFGMRRRAGLGRDWELAAMCGLAAIIYFILPFGWGAISYIDERALPFVFIPLLMLSLRIFESSTPGRDQITCLLVACSVLAAANFGSLVSFLPRQNREVAEFREALLTIPPRQIVLPIHTRRKDGNTWPLRHAGSFYTAERDGYTPYLFSNATRGGPSGYFADLSSIYRPGQDWYMGEGSADWDEIARSYDYVAITKPWKAERIDLRRLEMFYENATATVFRVRR